MMHPGTQFLPETGRGTMRSMVEGHRRSRLTSLYPAMRHVPLHHPCGMVPLPVPGRNR
jgi:hypothetical protein